MLVEMCPFFLTSKVVGKQEWLEMPTAAIPVAPESPGPAVAAAAVTDSPGTPRARPRALSVQGSPRSPGRVRTGLEEVRKRIRQELGEW
jgi:hypothetical protein